MKKELIVDLYPQSIYAEQYRTLRNNIYFSNFDKKLKVIQVTSSVPNEGKSTTIANLALSFVQNDKRVLIIDADMRKPTIHKKFRLSNLIGLSSIVIGEYSFQDAIQKEVYKGLDVLTSGPIPPNPSELLHSEGFKHILEDNKNRYDFILIDSPPVIPISDSKSIAHLCNGVILVCDMTSTHVAQIKNAKKEISKVNPNILGIICNKITRKTSDKYMYYEFKVDEADND